MNGYIDKFIDARQSSTLRSKIEIESKCQMCWDLSVGPIICNLCGNNVGCSKCVDGLFTTLNPTAKCPLCNADWRRDPQNMGNTSLWKGHCPNRALAGILNEIKQPTCSSIPAIQLNLMPSNPPELLPNSHLLYKPGSPLEIHTLLMIPPTCQPENNIMRTTFSSEEVDNLFYPSISYFYL
uniref:RING-type domain-containing protein n=1 Tax=Ditylenchus dipsaci TaxID=166011 RepID=A0A915CV30_9BILA